MNTTTFIGLVNNAALLLALTWLYDTITAKRRSESPALQALIGIILGAIGIAVMMTPWEFTPGVIFDTRSVLLSVGGLFFGAVPTLVAALMTGAYRLYQGGAGTWVGVAVIITSGAIGVGWRHLRRNGLKEISALELYLLGIVVHVAMLLWMLLLPRPIAIEVLSEISLPVMIVYPVGTVLLGKLMVARLARQQTEEALRRVNRALRVLSECNQVVVRATDEPALRQRVCQTLVEMGGYRLAWVGFAEQDAEKSVRPVAYAGFEDGYLDTLNLTWADTERGRGPTGVAIRSGAPALARNISTDPHFAPWRAEALRRGYASSIALPLIVGGQTLGALSIYAAEPDAFDSREVKLLTELAGDLAFGIAALRTRAERERAERLVRIQRDLAQVLSTARDVEEALALCVETAIDAAGMDAGGAYLVDRATGDLELVYSQGLSADSVGGASHYAAGSPNAQMMMAGRPVYTTHPGSGLPLGETDRREELRALAVIPVLSEGRVIGGINVASHTLDEVPDVARNTLESIAARMGDVIVRLQTEEKLRESEEKYRTILESIEDGYYEVDLAGNLVFFNDSLCKMLGYSPDELLGLNNRDFMDDATAKSVYQTFNEVYRTGRPAKAAGWELVRKDKGKRFIEASVSLVRDPTGEPIGFRGVARDVTERVRAEEALQASEERYRNMFYTVAVPIWEEDFSAVKAAIDNLNAQGVTDFPRYLDEHPEFVRQAARQVNVLDVNKATLNLFGASSKDELIGGLDKIFVPETLQIFKEEIIAIAEGQTYFEGETINQTLQGERLNVLIKMTIPSKEQEFANVLLSTVDVSARVRAEQERERLLAQIQERRSYLESVLAGTPDAIVTLDAQHNVREWNPGAENLFGYTPQEVVGRDIDDLIAWPDANVFEEATSLTRQVLAGGSVPPTETVRYRKDGSPVNVIVSGSPILLKGRVAGVVVVYTDITERKQIERQLRQQERLAAVGQLASGIAHDFNNMLTVIMLYAHQLLSQEQPSARTVSAAETIIKESKRAAKLVGQILDFSRRSPLETGPLVLAPFVKEVIHILERMLPESIHLHLDVGAEEYVIEADATRIQQVLMNLATNARDAMPEGGELRIELARVQALPSFISTAHPLSSPTQAAGKEWIRLSVSDTGTGIPSHVLDHIFEPFFTTKKPGKGTGLGLAQVYGIVAQHGGHIGVETELGQGTTFRIYLPPIRGEEQVTEEKVPTIPQGQGETILLIEDNENLRQGGRELLKSLGYRVLTGANGREALEICQAIKGIALVITDIVMPEMGGKQLMQELGKAIPDLKVMALTGYAMEESREELKEAGFLDVVYKPFEVDELAQAVRRVLDAE